MITQADSRKWMACLYNSFLFMEAKIMKMAKKLLAVVLTGVMAVSMLTGCALGDAVKEKAMFEQLKLAGKNNKPTEIVYKQDDKANNTDDTHKTAYDLKSALTAAKAEVKANAKTKDAAGVANASYATVKGDNTKAAFVYVVELPDSARKQDSWYSIASELNTKLANTTTGAFQKVDSATKHTIVVNYDIVDCNVRKDAAKETPTEKTSFLVVVAAPVGVNS